MNLRAGEISCRRSAETPLRGGGRFLRHRLAVLVVELPELFPEIFFQRMQERVAGHDRAQIPPFARMRHEFVNARIVQHVEARLGERTAQAILFAQHAVVRLLLQFKLDARGRAAAERGGEVFAEKLHGVALVTVHAQASGWFPR